MDRVANPKDIIYFFRHREQKEKDGNNKGRNCYKGRGRLTLVFIVLPLYCYPALAKAWCLLSDVLQEE